MYRLLATNRIGYMEDLAYRLGRGPSILGLALRLGR